MKHVWVRGCAVALLAASVSVLGAACVENESSLFIRACLVPSADTCSAEASEDAPMQSRGILDTAFASSGYRCQLLIGNQLVAVGSDTSLKAETSRVDIYGFDVTIVDDVGGVLASYTVPSQGFLDPASGSRPGYGIAEALLVDVQTAANVINKASGSAFFPEVIVSVVARGRTLGGTEVESGEWQFPVTVCSNCTCAGQDPTCDTGEDLKADCMFGRDGHCRFQETDCP